MFKLKALSFISLLSGLLLFNVNIFAVATEQLEENQVAEIQIETNQEHHEEKTKKEELLKVSQEAITSLTSQLSEQQFKILEKELVGQPYAELDFSALKTPESFTQEKAAAEAKTKTEAEAETATESSTEAAQDTAIEALESPETETATEQQEAEKKQILEKQAEEEGVVLFSEEDLEKIRNSLNAYLDMLTKIQQVAPLIQAANDIKLQIEKLEDGIGSLMKDEKLQVEEEIAELKTQFNTYMDEFKKISHQFDFESINFDKLPGMIDDLGYENSFYDTVFAYLSEYLGLVKKIETASSINNSQAEVNKIIKEKELELNEATTEQEKKAIAQEIEKLIKRKKDLNHEFTLNATGIDTSTLEQKDTKKISVEEELTKVFSPLIVGLTEITEPSRRVEFLRSKVTSYEQHLPKIRDGLKQVDTLLEDTRDAEVKRRLLEEKEHWQQQEKEFSAKLEVVKQQLIELENRKVSPIAAFEQFMQAIFSKRGLNILLSITFFFATFFILMFIRRFILLINPFSYIPKLRFIANIIDVILYLLTFVIAALVLMVSLFAAGEVLALALVVIILFGMAWAMRNTLPNFIEQIKLLLGFGPVREGEKVIYDGIAWEVDSIGIYSYFKNPLLIGGEIRLPLRDLIDLRSRPFDEQGEELFPCKMGDYLLLDQANYRRVLRQGTQFITFDVLGMEETMPTDEFLEKNITNLSKTPFWVMSTLHIAYRHRFEVIDEIIPKLAKYLEEEFKKTPFGEHLILVWVGYAGLSDTSINLLTWLQMKSEAAEKYNPISVNLNKICLNAANKYEIELVRFHAIQQHRLETPPEISDGGVVKSIPSS